VSWRCQEIARASSSRERLRTSVPASETWPLVLRFGVSRQPPSQPPPRNTVPVPGTRLRRAHETPVYRQAGGVGKAIVAIEVMANCGRSRCTLASCAECSKQSLTLSCLAGVNLWNRVRLTRSLGTKATSWAAWEASLRSRWVRIFLITTGSSMQAMIFTGSHPASAVAHHQGSFARLAPAGCLRN
jgi:hypothetical protein